MKLLLHKIKYRTQILLHSLGWHISRWHPLKQETDVVAIQKSIVSVENPLILDVGAWIGKTAAKYVQEFDRPQVHCFEPFPDSFSKLKENTKAISKSIVYNEMAISNHTGTDQFCVNKIETTNSLLDSTSTDSSQDFFRDTLEKIDVNTDTLDKYCANNVIEKVDILKMDTQGGELKGLEGAKGLLSSQRISLIYCEVSFVAMYDQSPLYHDIANFLAQYNYRLHGLYGLVKNERGQLMWGDAIFYSDNTFNKYTSNSKPTS